jgi:hypothetical protein
MKVQVLQVPGCPHAPVLIARLHLLISGRTVVETRVIHDQGEAESWRMPGSPTVLIDGVDPFPAGGQPPGLSCRLYRDETGSLSGSPSLTQLREVLAASGISHA